MYSHARATASAYDSHELKSLATSNPALSANSNDLASSSVVRGLLACLLACLPACLTDYWTLFLVAAPCSLSLAVCPSFLLLTLLPSIATCRRAGSRGNTAKRWAENMSTSLHKTKSYFEVVDASEDHSISPARTSRRRRMMARPSTSTLHHSARGPTARAVLLACIRTQDLCPGAATHPTKLLRLPITLLAWPLISPVASTI